MRSLLGAVEALLLGALREVIDPQRVTTRSPSKAPPPGPFPQVTVAATEALLQDPPLLDRRSIRTNVEVTWPVTAGTRVFPLPEGASSDLAELLASTGHLLLKDDDFHVESGEVRLHRALPRGASSLRGYLAGDPAEGYSERMKASIGAEVTTWSDTPQTLDPLSAQVSAALPLLAASRRTLRTAVDIGTARVEFILRDALPRWRSTQRRQIEGCAPPLLCDLTTVDLSGDLELRVLLGPALSDETIRLIRPAP